MVQIYLSGVKMPKEATIARKFDLTYDGEISAHSYNVLNYEGGVLDAQKSLLRLGDHVVIVGGGNGVTAVKAAHIIGQKGSKRGGSLKLGAENISGGVIVFEGGASECETLRKVSKLNNVDNIVELNHAVVGIEKNVYSDTTHAKIIPPSKIPECDVLELDCEGSELEILANMKIRPRNIIVELHPWEYPSEPMRPVDVLLNLGYEIRYIAGHDGIHTDQSGLHSLLERSSAKMGEHDHGKKSLKYLTNGARWPVVIGCNLK